ncbi:hypothetical protein ACKKBG_A27550 [Auxenochlorella protothecoides x Auxenochlorella symbiontica]
MRINIPQLVLWALYANLTRSSRAQSSNGPAYPMFQTVLDEPSLSLWSAALQLHNLVSLTSGLGSNGLGFTMFASDDASITRLMASQGQETSTFLQSSLCKQMLQQQICTEIFVPGVAAPAVILPNLAGGDQGGLRVEVTAAQVPGAPLTIRILDPVYNASIPGGAAKAGTAVLQQIPAANGELYIISAVVRVPGIQ